MAFPYPVASVDPLVGNKHPVASVLAAAFVAPVAAYLVADPALAAPLVGNMRLEAFAPVALAADPACLVAAALVAPLVGYKQVAEPGRLAASVVVEPVAVEWALVGLLQVVRQPVALVVEAGLHPVLMIVVLFAVLLRQVEVGLLPALVVPEMDLLDL